MGEQNLWSNLKTNSSISCYLLDDCRRFTINKAIQFVPQWVEYATVYCLHGEVRI